MRSFSLTICDRYPDHHRFNNLNVEPEHDRQAKSENYDALHPQLRQYVSASGDIEESIDDRAPRYAVRYGGREYVIYSPELDDDSWGRATYAFFSIINDQLTTSTHPFYAINGGNDLGGMFLTPAEAEATRTSLPKKTDWPYLPTPDGPWTGNTTTDRGLKGRGAQEGRIRFYRDSGLDVLCGSTTRSSATEGFVPVRVQRSETRCA